MAKPTFIRPLRDHEIKTTLASCLVDVADCTRQLYTDFGLRPYRVFLVWIGWTADENDDGMLQDEELCLEDNMVGVGRPVVLADVELVPTPLVGDLTAVAKTQDVTGLTERGGVGVSQISASMSEDVLMGLITPFRDPDNPDTLLPGIEFFWEVQQDRPAGFALQNTQGCDFPTELKQPRRRFHVSGTPSLDQGAFEWSVALVRADGERGRGGDVEAVG